jgi:hypothetical protein
MKKITTVFAFVLFLSSVSYSQIEDRFSLINEENVNGYAAPFVTMLGTAFNSGGYHSASISKVWGFGVKFVGMYILIPDEQKTFTPSSVPPGYITGEESATIFGNRGAALAGSDGFLIFPPGIDLSAVPAAIPQLSVSAFGTEAIIRYLPAIPVGESEISMWGLGVKHSVSQYIPLIPVDIAVQVMLSNLTLKDIIDLNNFAINAHVSKTFGIFTAYSGLQYENSGLDLEYTINGDPKSPDPKLRVDRDVKVSIDGDNNFRFTLGGTLKLAIIALNVDYNIGSQSAVTGGLSFEF